MTEPSPDPATEPSPPAMPAWVKALGVALAVLVLLGLAAALLGGGPGGHGPGMHRG